MQEAQALDKAMEERERRLGRKGSVSSMCSASSSGIGMGQAWRNKYGNGRNRTGSIASVLTNSSVLTEDLVEEELLRNVSPELEEPWRLECDLDHGVSQLALE